MAAKKSKSSSRSRGAKQKVNTPPKKRVVNKSASKSTAASSEKTTVKSSPRKEVPQVQLPFTRKNYLLLIVGVGMIALGFFLMSLDDFVDASKFSISLYIAPPIVVAGFLEIIYAIMYKEKPTPASDN